MNIPMLLGETGHLLGTVEAEITGGQLPDQIGSLSQAGRSPAHTPRRLVVDIGPGRHPIHDRPIAVHPMRPATPLFRDHAICTARHDPISRSPCTNNSSS